MGKESIYLQVYLESPAQSFSTRGDRLLHLGRRWGRRTQNLGNLAPLFSRREDSLVAFGQKVGNESTESLDVPGESSPNTFHERRQVSYIWAEGGEGKHQLQVYLESPAQPFSTREDRLVTFGHKAGKESTLESPAQSFSM